MSMYVCCDVQGCSSVEAYNGVSLSAPEGLGDLTASIPKGNLFLVKQPLLNQQLLPDFVVYPNFEKLKKLSCQSSSFLFVNNSCSI